MATFTSGPVGVGLRVSVVGAGFASVEGSGIVAPEPPALATADVFSVPRAVCESFAAGDPLEAVGFAVGGGAGAVGVGVAAVDAGAGGAGAGVEMAALLAPEPLTVEAVLDDLPNIR